MYGLWAKHPREVTIISVDMVSSHLRNNMKILLSLLTIYVGEGLKIGIIALLRNRIGVTYYTNREVWKFIFSNFNIVTAGTSNLLAVNLDRTHPNLAKADKNVHEDTRDAHRSAHKDTTVIVQGQRDLDIQFSDYLFLVRPPPQTILRTDRGMILTGEDHCRKIFVKSILVDEIDSPPLLAYGVNFDKAKVNRDRRSLMRESKLTKELSKIWNNLIENDVGGAVEMYLKLLLEKDVFLETMEASDYITQTSAEKLWEKLTAMFLPETFFYDSEDKDVAQVPH